MKFEKKKKKKNDKEVVRYGVSDYDKSTAPDKLPFFNQKMLIVSYFPTKNMCCGTH